MLNQNIKLGQLQNSHYQWSNIIKIITERKLVVYPANDSSPGKKPESSMSFFRNLDIYRRSDGMRRVDGGQ